MSGDELKTVETLNSHQLNVPLKLSLVCAVCRRLCEFDKLIDMQSINDTCRDGRRMFDELANRLDTFTNWFVESPKKKKFRVCYQNDCLLKIHELFG